MTQMLRFAQHDIFMALRVSQSGMQRWGGYLRVHPL